MLCKHLRKGNEQKPLITVIVVFQNVPLTNDITGISGIISLLDPNDSVMMDKGFVIADLLDKAPASYAIPPFSQMNCQQFEENDSMKSQKHKI